MEVKLYELGTLWKNPSKLHMTLLLVTIFWIGFGLTINNINNLLLIRRKYLYEYIQMRLTSYIKIIIK